MLKKEKTVYTYMSVCPCIHMNVKIRFPLEIIKKIIDVIGYGRSISLTTGIENTFFCVFRN